MSGLRPFTITTARLTIRRFLLGEVDYFVAIRNDPHLLQYLPWLHALSSADAWTFMTRQAVVNPGARSVEAHMAIVDDQTSALIGVCFIKVDSSGQQAELGIMLARSWQGRGYEQEAVRALAAWAKTSNDGPGVGRLTITVDARDTSGLAAFGAAGFAVVSQGMWAGQFPYYILTM